MTLFSSADEQQTFLQNIWQQGALLIPNALPDIKEIVDGEQLFDLACETEVESRLISGRGLHGSWRCQQGPFVEEDFAQLPAENWTLLVQGLDQWSEEVNAILDAFHFLPRWRLEDIMASYAPQGGGVGPHFDYYDVFLLQVSGQREWQLGQACDDASPLQKNDEVKLLTEFISQENYQVKPGDLLYIPAGLAHWGTALTDDCITLSVGFRAPSHKELLMAALGNLLDDLSDAGMLSGSQRYRDGRATIDANPAKINQAVHQQLNQYLSVLTPERLQQSINQAFGQLVTEPRYTHIEDEPPQDYVKLIIETLKMQSHIELCHPVHSRFAFSDTQLFVNGEAFNVSESFAKGVCEGRVEGSMSDHEMVFLVELLEKGDLEMA